MKTPRPTHDDAAPTRDLDQILSAAAADASDASASVVEISKARLEVILHLPSNKRIDHLDDVDLTAADRRRLKNSITISPTSPSGDKPHGKSKPITKASIKFGGGAKANSITGRELRLAFATGLILGAPLLAWSNTATGVKLTAPAIGLLETRSGPGERIDLMPGMTIAVRSRWRNAEVRWWTPRSGYGRLNFPKQEGK